MNERIIKQGYKISKSFYDLVNFEIIPGIEIDEQTFWCSFIDILDEFIPENQQLLTFRETLQTQINDWHTNEKNEPFNQSNYENFLNKIGYLVPEKEDFTITTNNVDDEIAVVAGPQLVVPLMNARFVLNAANARWGSLYDALYGTDVIADDNGAARTTEYNPVRGARVQAYARQFLDNALPLVGASHVDAIRYHIVDHQLVVILKNGQSVSLVDSTQFKGFNGSYANPSAVLCCHQGLHIEIQINEFDLVGKTDSASVKDILLESALTTIQDCEDSIAAVDTADKIVIYRNWLGLMKGNLTETFDKGGKRITRSLNPDRTYLTPFKQPMSLPGRSLQFIRNVGHLMTTDIILTSNNDEVPEGIVDALVTSLIALHDLQGAATSKNSKKGSIYIVKPKMHGPEEIKFCNELFSRIEQCLNLSPNTIKMGIMDEERRTSVNLKECIRAAKERVAFINTGFLDRTGDEIHTSMLAGPMTPKELMKHEKWISIYESRNVRIGLQAGFKGKAQIGKGMWAIPEQMSAMLKEKITHLQSGANCAWVPSPTAATLHAMHYHQIDVSKVQDNLQRQYKEDISLSNDLSDLLTIPLLKNRGLLSQQDIQNELDNNIQGLLGYVVRWIDQGIGCSTVPDINNIGRMEDRATLRISSQHICNWLHHKIINEVQVMASLKKMATVVDQQNVNDPNYQAMSDSFETSIAFMAASDLIFKGKEQPSGYTEPLLHQKRKQIKA